LRKIARHLVVSDHGRVVELVETLDVIDLVRSKPDSRG
jgi:hypothetical protein